MLARTLVELGLHDTEARFYLAALELGEATIRDIAAKASISRTNAYDVAQRLSEQGLVVCEGAGGRGMRAVAVDPDRLLEVFESRRQRLQSILPDLRSLHVGSLAKPRVRYHEGRAGIQSVLEATLACRSKSLLGILSMLDLYEVPGRAFMDDLVARRIAAGVFLRVVRSRSRDIHGSWRASAADLRELRFAPEDFATPMTTYIYDDMVAIISSRRENFAMTIESAELAALQRQTFEVLWAASARPPAAPMRKPRAKRLASMQ